MKYSNLDKILFTKSKITKEDILDYYAKISSYFLAHVQNHPIVLQRFPNGIDQESFFQKNVPDYYPKFIKTTTVTLKKGGKQKLVIINNKKTLLYLANQATIVFHSWLSSTKSIHKPDKIVFDLDPSPSLSAQQSLKLLRFTAKKLKILLDEHDLTSFIMTTGSSGFHITVPLKPEFAFLQIHKFAKNIAQKLSDQYPDFITCTATKSQRKNKIFIDYLRNSYGQTSVACYSIRAHEKAPIATPILWEELNSTTPQKFTIKNIFKRLSEKNDPWKNFNKSAQKLKISS